MLLAEPNRTSYDLTFPLFGFEIRTHPAFFILPLLFGYSWIQGFTVNPGVGLLIVAGVFWTSILIHELGHAFAFRYFGISSRIVLYWMGGLAIPQSGNLWSSRQTGSLTPNQQIIVSLAGPFAGLLLALILCLIVPYLSGSIGWHGIFPVPSFPDKGPVPFGSAVHLVFSCAIVINVVLNLINLVPVFPLDGGKVARNALIQMDPWNGIRKSLILSIVAAIGMALISLRLLDGIFIAIFFGLMAHANFQELQGPRW